MWQCVGQISCKPTHCVGARGQIIIVPISWRRNIENIICTGTIFSDCIYNWLKRFNIKVSYRLDTFRREHGMPKERKEYNVPQIPPNFHTIFYFLLLLSGKAYVSKRPSVFIHKRGSTQVAYIVRNKYRSK